MKLTKARLKQIIKEEIENLGIEQSQEPDVDDFMDMPIGDTPLNESDILGDYILTQWLLEMGLTNGEALFLVVGLPVAAAFQHTLRLFIREWRVKSKNKASRAQEKAASVRNEARAAQVEVDLILFLEHLAENPNFETVVEELRVANKTNSGVRSAVIKFNELVRNATTEVEKLIDSDPEELLASLRRQVESGELQIPEQSLEDFENRISLADSEDSHNAEATRLRRMAGMQQK